jgi:hypothetical protein
MFGMEYAGLEAQKGGLLLTAINLVRQMSKGTPLVIAFGGGLA